MRRRLVVSITLLFAVLAVGITVAVSFLRQASSELSELVRLYQIEGRRHNLELVIQRAQQDLLVSETVFANNLDSVIRNVRRLDQAIEVCAGWHHEPPTRLTTTSRAGAASSRRRGTRSSAAVFSSRRPTAAVSSCRWSRR